MSRIVLRPGGFVDLDEEEAEIQRERLAAESRRRRHDERLAEAEHEAAHRKVTKRAMDEQLHRELPDHFFQ